MKTKNNNKGFSLMELLVVISFVSVITFLILGLTSANNKVRKLNEEQTQAVFYATEALEAINLLDWNDLTAGDYAVNLEGNQWALSAGSQLLADKYTRTIIIDDVYRENSQNGQVYGAIADSGFLDPDTKKVTATVSWQSRAGLPQQETLTRYIYRFKASRWQQNDWVGGDGQETWSDSTKFSYKDAGIKTSLPGIVTLEENAIDWNFANTTSTYDTPGNFDDNDVDEANNVAYLVTENNPYGAELYLLDVSDVANPFLLSSLDIGSSVTAVVVQGDYLYLSTGDNVAEFQIIDVSNSGSPFLAASYDLPSNDDALDVAVDASDAYVVQSSYIYSFDISDPTSPELLDQVDVDDEAREIFLSDNYVYVATLDDNKELQIIDVTNPANMAQAGLYNLPGSLKGSDVNVKGNRAFISTQNNGGGGEFFALDVSDPTNPTLLGEYEVGESIHSFSIIGPYALLGTNFLDQELVVVDISNPQSMGLLSGFDLKGYVLGMSANCSVIYAATSGNQGEFFIISTDVMDCEYADFGSLDSSTFDTGSDEVTYNWIAWSGSEPVGTDVRLQIATSNNPSGPWNFVGPDGSGFSYYTDPAQEYINYSAHLNQRYIRYRLYLDNSSEWYVPEVEAITISYSTYP